MRYEDASETGSFNASEAAAQSTLSARNDADVILAGHYGPATGNAITGTGTISGSAGADMVGAGATITAIQGAGGTDTSFSSGHLQVAGQYGVLTIDAHGAYSYVRNHGTPNGVSDVFSYTLAGKDGSTDVANLTINIGKTPTVVQANAVQVVPGPDGVVTLPAGVELSDIHVVGRNLVIDMPDGTQMIIIDGAVFVPQLVLGTVEVPSTNLAALLIDSEPTPAAGPPQSSGGNFEVPVPPLDPGAPLGDLIPPTELSFTPPDVQEVNNAEVEDEELTVVIVTPDNPAGAVNAVDSVEEAGLPARPVNEPEGSGEEAAAGANGDTSEATTGTIVIDAPDGIGSVTINGALVTGVGQTIAGVFGTLVITSAVGPQIGYSYTLLDNTSGNNTADLFTVVVADIDGDLATATLTVNIIDDVPTARPDTDSIAAGGFGPATGNVITDAAAGDVGDSDNGRDTVGADNATITAVSSANVPANVDTNPGAGFLIAGQYGVLTLNTDGSYSYVRNAGTPGGVNDVFNYTLTDGDGDTSTTTLTISIGDSTPQTGQNPTALLDDDALPGGIPGGVGDDVDAANLSGTLAASGGDGPLSYDLLLTGAPAGFTYVDGPAGSVLVQQGGVTVLTITVNAATGAYTVTQNAPIDHPAGGDENNQAFTLNYTATDQDGDVASGTLGINVDDDTPEMNRADVSLPTLTVDETDLAVNASANYSVVFAGSFGADGPGTTSYAVSVVNGTDSGLVDVATGDPILLFNNAGVVEGRVGGSGGLVAFTVSVNSGTGVVTLDQIRALDHPDVSNPDDPVSPTGTSIQLVATITDGDGDPDSLAVNIGSSLVFEDDGPSVSPGAAEPTLVVDESNLTFDRTLNFTDAFTAAFGADGPAGSGLLDFSLGINAGATGLVDTATGLAVVLSVEGGMVVGRAGPGGAIVFTVGANAAGDVTLDQQRAVVHPDATNPNDSISLATDDLITITATATDADGDTASVTIGIGRNIVLEDDGPSAVNDVDSIASGLFGPATGNVLTGVDIIGGDANATDGSADAPGADGGAVSQIQSVNVPANIDNTAAGGNFVVNGQYGVLTINVDGSYSYVRGAGTPGGVSDVFTYTLTDGDGDPTTATLTINIDDATPHTDPNPTALLDDDAQANGNPGGTGDDPDNVNTAGTLSGSGGDGPLTFAVQLTGAPAGFSYVSGGAGIVLVQQGATTVLTVTVNANGNYSVVQNAPINHAAGLNENNTAFTINYTVTDQDGDSAPGSFGINVDDDTPIASQNQLGGTVDEDGVPGGIAGGTGDVAGENPVATGSVATLFASGADVPLTFSLLANTAGLPALTSAGVAVTYAVVGNTLTASAGANTVFTFVLQANGNYTFTLVDQLDHPTLNGVAGDNTENDLTIALGTIIQATDNDGDSVAANANGLVITVDDDTPTASATLLTGTVDEDGVPGGIAGGTGDVAGESTVATGSVATLFNSGADAPLSYSLLVNTAGLPALTSAGVAVTYAVVGNTLTASAGANTVFTFVLQANGNYTFTLVDQIDHPTLNGIAGDNTENDLSIALGSIIQATDADGDSVAANANGLVITVDDDMPVANNDVDTIVGGNGPATGNVITGVDFGGGDANATDGTADSVGADAPGTITLIASNNVPANTDSTYTAGNLVVAGQYGVLTINANGNYSYLRTDGSPGGVNDIFTYTLTDADGDSVTATLNIGIDDKVPTAGNVNVLLDDDALANGNPGGTGDDVNAQNVAGNLPGSGGDGVLTWDLLLTGAPAGFTYIDGPAGSVLVQQGGTTVLTITINPANGAYTVTQNAPINHPTLNGGAGDDTENNVPFTINYTVTDADGDPANGTISINVDDDTPIATATLLTGTVDEDGVPGGIAGGTGDVAGESTVATGNVATMFASGADTPLTFSLLANTAGLPALTSNGVPVTYAVVGGTLTASAGVGNTVFTFVLQANGNYTFTLVDQLDHASLNGVAGDNTENDLSIALGTIIQATDNDGDSVTGNANGLVITVDDDTPTATATLLTGTVDEDGVREGASDTGPGDGIAGGTGDVAGEIVVATGSVVTLFNSGADAPLSYTLSAVTAGLPALTSGGVAVTYAVVGDTLTASAGAGNTVFTFVLNANGSYTFTLVDQLDHATLNGVAGDNTENDLSIALGSIIQATDADGDSVIANANGLVITVDDDSPTLGTIQNGTANNLPGSAHSVGTLHFEIGADETATSAAAVANITVNVNGATSGGKAIVTNLSGNVLTAYQDVGPAGYDAGDTTVVFTLTVDPYAATSGQYDFDLVTPLDPTVTETAIGGSTSFGAGPTTQGQVLDSAAAVHLSVVSGYHMGGTFNEATWLSTGSAGPAGNYVTAGVNGSTAGWGIDNNNFNGTDEMFVWDFGSQALANPDGAGGFVPPAGVTLPDISTATYELIGYSSASDDISYVVHYTDGTFDSGHIPAVDMDDGSWKFTADAGKFIADIEMFTSGTGSGKVDLTSVGVQNSSLNQNLNFTVTMTDADGDQVSGGFTMNVNTANSPSTPVPPIALDLNGDGVHFLGHDAGVTYDYNGDGVREATGWVGADDGILVHDANHNGTVDNASEFVFAANDGGTDLQGLAASYDSNSDGVLNASDADFASFAVWQDANSNGVADAGEVQSLTDAGITGVSLSSDGIAYTAAGGDVDVAGTGSYTRADGSTGLLADASFFTGSRSAEDQRSISAANTNTALIAALAAAGVAAAPAAAQSADPAPATVAAVAAAVAASSGPSIAGDDDVSRSALGGESKEAVGDDASHASSSSSSAGHEPSGGHSLTAANDTSPAAQPNDLLGATDAPASHDAPSIVAPVVSMPSAEALIAAKLEGGNSGDSQPVHSDAAVGSVLADALEGGGGEQSVDALLAALPANGLGENAAADALASQPVGAVPAWDSGHAGGFTHAANFTIEAAVLHHDAVQAVANG